VWIPAALLGVAVIAAVAVMIASGRSSSGPTADPTRASVLTVGSAPVGHPIPSSFVGLSIEFPALEQYAGNNPDAVNPILLTLIRNLAPGQRPVLRVGGDSTDWAWWPVPHMAKPLGIRYVLTPRWVRTTHTIVKALNAQLILGINLEADSTRLAAVEARELVDGIGPGSIEALELGNEPELYGAFGWYTPKGGRPVHGRPRGYDIESFTRDFSRFAPVLPRLPLAGPTTGAPAWVSGLAPFLDAEPRVRVATLHLYPLQHCGVKPSSPVYPTIPHLLLPSSTLGLAQRVARYVAIAHARGVALRIDEMNSVSCGATPSVSQTFAASLWSVNALFALARVGVDGVNIHTYPGLKHELFRFTDTGHTWKGLVDPEYYGMLMFAQAAPAGARLLSLAGSAGSHVAAWATRAPDGQIRVVLINDSAGQRAVTVRVPAGSGVAALERLQAPSVHARTGVTLGGRTFGAATTTGQLAAPVPDSVTPTGGGYSVSLPATSAAMLTLSPPQ
jgi:Glycosyl hydrolase family 79 C-terminal beta domain